MNVILKINIAYIKNAISAHDKIIKVRLKTYTTQYLYTSYNNKQYTYSEIFHYYLVLCILFFSLKLRVFDCFDKVQATQYAAFVEEKESSNLDT